MQVISVWQPFASLLVNGHKKVETRTWPAPRKAIYSRIGIASTRIVRREQTALMDDSAFLACYEKTGLLPFDALPHGYLLGTVEIVDCVLITADLIAQQSESELVFGDWQTGRFAWFVQNPKCYDVPIRVRGRQGLWMYMG